MALGRRLVPPDVPARLHGCGSFAWRDDDAAHRRRALQRRVERRLHRDGLAAPARRFHRDHRDGVGVGQPRDDGLLAETGKERQRDRADADDGEECDHGFGTQRQEDADDLAGLDALREEAARQGADLARELRVSQSTRLARFAFKDDRVMRAAPGREMTVEQRRRHVHGRADAPARVRRPVRNIANRAERRLETNVEKVDQAFPEPVGLRLRFGLQRRIVGQADGAKKTRPVGRRALRLAGAPHAGFVARGVWLACGFGHRALRSVLTRGVAVGAPRDLTACRFD